MSSLKCKLLLWLVALMVLTVPLYAADVVVWSESFGTTDGADGTDNADWAMSSGSDWEVGLPVAANGDPGASPGGGQILGYALGDLYNNGMATPKYATSPEIDCTDLVGVKLTFQRWLTVEDGGQDLAFVQVSNDGSEWITVWQNPSDVNDDPGDADPFEADLVDTSWKTVEYDISAVADGQETVQVRWGLKSNGATPVYDPATVGRYGGWNIDDVEITASGPDAIDVPTWTGTGTWENGAPVASAGHDLDDDGVPGNDANDDDDPLTPDPTAGKDPAADSDGDDLIWGTDIVGTGADNPVAAGDYNANDQTPDYLTSSGFDCTGRNGTAVSFMRWLQVADGAFDKASVQVQVDNDPDTLLVWENDEVVSDDTEVVLDEDGAEYTWEVDTAQFYEIIGALTYVAEDFGTGTDVEVEVSPDGEDGTWISVGTIVADTADPDVPDELAFGILGVPFSDGSLFVKATMDIPTDGTGTVTFSNLTVEGQLWSYAWQNPADTDPPYLFDEDWTLTEVPIGEWADDQANVRVRFAMGKTTAFLPKWGGWSLDELQIVEASREFRGMAVDAPESLMWDEEADFTVTLKNTGTATWDSRHAAFEALVNVQEEDALGGEPEDSLDIAAKVATRGTPFPINRWAVGSIAVGDEDTVDPDASYDFEGTLIAPPLSSIRYATPMEDGVQVEGDLDASALDLAFNLANTTEVADPDPAPYYLQTGVANGKVVVTRFSDDQPGTPGAWARYYIEELAGKVPFVVQGFGNGTYRSTVPVKRDAIAVFIFRAAELPDSVGALGSVFQDVDPDYWAVNEIQSCYENSIVNGYAGNVYRPTVVVKRGQMCKFIVNGVNFAQPGTFAVPSLAAVDAAGQDLYPFGDVVAVDDPDTDDNEQNNLCNYILAAAVDATNTDWPAVSTLTAPVVQGFAAGPDEDLPSFRPMNDVTRGQLAAFVFRGFMRDFGSDVVLGGPGITSAIGAGDLVANVAPYSGLASRSDFVQADDADDLATAYVTFDAVRLPVADITVDFVLTEAAQPTATYTVVIPALTVGAWQTQITDVDEDDDTDGEPYKTVAVPLDLGALDYGNYTMTTSVNGTELSRTVALALMNQMFFEDWEAGFDTVLWEYSGQPSGQPAIYGDDSEEDNSDVIADVQSLELQGTQVIEMGYDTGGRHDIQLSAELAAVDFGDGDSLTVFWSKDGGQNWIEAFGISGEDAPAELESFSVSLPNGLEFTDPDAWDELDTEEQADPANWGADNNSEFMIKIVVEIDDANEDGRGYIDNIEIRGT